MALIVTGNVSDEYSTLNAAAKEVFKIQWARDDRGVVEAGCVFLHNYGKTFSLYGQKPEFNAFIGKFIDVLISVKTNIYIIEKGSIEKGKSPEYFDEASLRMRYPEFQIFKVRIEDFFNRETFHGVPIYVANEKWAELIDEDLLHFRTMVTKVQEKSVKFGRADNVNPLAILGLAKPPPIKGYLKGPKNNESV